jgi:hypothetical protein
MNYQASLTDFFKPPKWMMNLLLAGLSGLIPLIGPMIIKGWLITGFWGRDDERPETFPEFDFNNFGKYLERGLWPFLVTFVASLGLGLLCAIFVAPIMMVASLVSAGSHDNSCLGGLMALFMIFFYLIVAVVMVFLLTPLTLRASMTQDFGQSFDIAFVKRFISLMWKEILISSLFLIAVSVLLVCVGLLVFCIGVWFSYVPVYFCWMHLYKQLYRLYLSRGGEPIPLSPKLRDALPPAATL